MVLVTIIAVALPLLLAMLLAAAFLLGRHWQRRHVLGETMSPVTRQHIQLFQGGQLNENLVDAAKRRICDQLERGELATVEANLRPGMQFVVQVRALAEIGTEEAGRILERQLQRRLTDDPLEQSWYWIDLANGLRSLHREESLPHLLRCAETAGELPLGHFFAAETICFLGFAGQLRQPDGSLGRAALRVLHRALEGLRYGVPPYLILEARLGELVENLWDHRAAHCQALLVRVIAETLRLLRREPHIRSLLADETAEQEAFDWQLSRLTALEPALSDYLDDAPRQLSASLTTAQGHALRDVLLALNDLRADTGTTLLPHLSKPEFPQHELAVEVLTWCRSPEAGTFLRDWVRRYIALPEVGKKRRRAETSQSFPTTFPYRAILRALRGQPSAETETILLAAATDADATFRGAALGSLGWWEPVARDAVLSRLHEARKDPHPDVRKAARAALARLGERLALQWFRQALTTEDPQRVHEIVQNIANEGITLLWPDVDRLADSKDPDVAHLAREALERMGEEMTRR